MADILLDEQSVPAAPAAGQGLLYVDTEVSLFATKNDAGRGFAAVYNYATVAQLLGVVDTYIAGSNVRLPSFGMQAGMRYLARLSLSKTAAGVAAPVFNVRIGTNGTTADTARVTIATTAQTAAIETGFIEVNVVLRNTGAAGVLQTALVTVRTGGIAATGLAIVPVIENTSAPFDTAFVSGQLVGLSIDPGAGSAWTVTQVQAELTF